ncbi:hypothetical protein [Desulfobacula sp.]|uniref:hypothetical protein n=1 Tax=Desulfobacula sp. TaxID=2593537 RepID=UPI002637A462|nr:hypothetical protein [Desulfobacula sp.]
MGTRYLFEKAVRISQGLPPSDETQVQNLCRKIKESQEALLVAGSTSMQYCLEKCKGMCCQNLDIDSIFSLWDFIFILTLLPHLKDDIQHRLNAHDTLYLSPCPFLKDGKGPCIFPNGIKAQICVITFCADSHEMKQPIKTVNLNFYRLCWLIQYLRIKRIVCRVKR